MKLIASLSSSRHRSLQFVHSKVSVNRLFKVRFQDLEGAEERLVDGHDGAGVVELAAKVRRGEDRDLAGTNTIKLILP